MDRPLFLKYKRWLTAIGVARARSFSQLKAAAADSKSAAEAAAADTTTPKAAAAASPTCTARIPKGKAAERLGCHHDHAVGTGCGSNVPATVASVVAAISAPVAAAITAEPAPVAASATAESLLGLAGARIEHEQAKGNDKTSSHRQNMPPSLHDHSQV